MVSVVQKRIMRTVEKGEQQAAVARDILAIGKKAGIDLVAEETELISLESKLRELKAAAEPEESGHEE